ncbi:hypothetical protein GCM10010435_30650 [Winogradskya consettensis]|uniref:Oligopeptide/dipeptide ABC transporter C-terminal domain-containing protein n=1 Tax=Winogradskya consettensis TaxID=113560 RepID=A0A919SEY2_9ACTN|nr:oligopeptide/dipeptide ABC transporter ATP-binding protein [Actinoplanes consettensis]GIM70550.1 hypothetical protein Aco04nite_20850 [Actinoplanes consettensis]
MCFLPALGVDLVELGELFGVVGFGGGPGDQGVDGRGADPRGPAHAQRFQYELSEGQRPAIADLASAMYLWRIVEIGDAEAVFGTPRHPYTKALLRVPDLAVERDRERILLIGDPLSAGSRPAGCPLYAGLSGPDRKLCEDRDPALTGDNRRRTACHHAGVSMI